MPLSIPDLIAFYKEAQKLKMERRHSWLPDGVQETVAMHGWLLALMAFISEEEAEGINIPHVIKMVLVHDLGEIHAKDLPAWADGHGEERQQQEREGIQRIGKLLSPEKASEILELWEEFEALETPESQFARSLDIMEAKMQHNLADLSTWTEEEYDFHFEHGQELANCHPFIRKFRDAVDEWGREKICNEKQD